MFGKRERVIKRILVVEDEPLVAFENEHFLSDSGYEVVGTVDTLEEALRFIDGEEPIDLVLTDIALNGEGSGIEVAEAAHARGIKVLFVTGNFPGHAKHLAVGCLSKPYSSRVLKGALDAVELIAQGEPVKKLPEQLTLFDHDIA